MAATQEEIDVHAEVIGLRRLVETLNGRLERLEGGSTSKNGDGPTSRRDLLKVATAAVAGVAGGMLLGPTPAAAADGASVVLGNTDPTVTPATANDAGFTTRLTATTGKNPSPLLQVVAQGGTVPVTPPASVVQVIGPLASVPTGATAPTFSGQVQSFAPAQATGGPAQEGVDGWAPGGAGAGVQGLSDSGYGIVGNTSMGIDLAALGTGRLFQFSLTDNTGAPVAGPPSFTPAQPPTFPGGELMRDKDGVLWASRATGTAQAAWKRVNAVRLDAADGSGTPFVPTRVLNTTNNSGTGTHMGPLLPGEIVDFGPFTNANGVPSDAIGVMGNLTAVASTSTGALSGTFPVPGWLAITPGGVSANQANPVSNVNYGGPVNAVPNFFAVGFGTGANAGKLRIQNGGNTKVHILIDFFSIFQ